MLMIRVNAPLVYKNKYRLSDLSSQFVSQPQMGSRPIVWEDVL